MTKIYEFTITYNQFDTDYSIVLVGTDVAHAAEEATYEIPCAYAEITSVTKGKYLYDE